MNALEIYNEIKTKHPDLVENKLDRSSLESDSERQTIYGDLMDWMRDYYTLIPLADREQVVRLLLGDYVIQHPYCLQKVYIVQQESNVDGELIINAVPCTTREAARKVLQGMKNFILHESPHYMGRTKDELEEEFEIEEGGDRWYINDPCDDYYEDIQIVEKIIVIR
jgi:hypothetical protein